jgi:hypothetical protein
VITRDASAIPIVRSEVQLLYMATAMEPKHLCDFDAAQPALSDVAATWLAEALAATLPGHPWIARLV